MIVNDPHAEVACSLLSERREQAASASQAEMQPQPGSTAEYAFGVIDLVFTALFTTELAINLFANWFWPFWTVSAIPSSDPVPRFRWTSSPCLPAY